MYTLNLKRINPQANPINSYRMTSNKAFRYVLGRGPPTPPWGRHRKKTNHENRKQFRRSLQFDINLHPTRGANSPHNPSTNPSHLNCQKKKLPLGYLPNRVGFFFFFPFSKHAGFLCFTRSRFSYPLEDDMPNML